MNIWCISSSDSSSDDLSTLVSFGFVGIVSTFSALSFTGVFEGKICCCKSSVTWESDSGSNVTNSVPSQMYVSGQHCPVLGFIAVQFLPSFSNGNPHSGTAHTISPFIQ